LPGKFFPVANQKKASVNHCYLSVTFLKSAGALGVVGTASKACLAAFTSIRERTEQAMADNEPEGGAGEAAEVIAAPRSKLKLIIMVVAVLAILGGGSATWFFFFRHHDEEAHAEMAPPPKPPVFVEVPEMLVNLAGAPGDRIQYLKVKLVLEVKEEKQSEAIKPSMPRVTDIFQTFLRELRPSDLNGSAGLFRLKEELTRRVNAAVAPIQVSAVLFKEIVVQ
jgi:flagellar FliL protein